METTATKLKATLRQARYSATQPRLAVFNQLAKDSPASVGSLAKQLEPAVDRATVYRTIELYEKLGIVNRIWHGFKNQVELSEIFTPHHHHALCQNCGATTDITSPELEAALSGVARQHGFLAVSHSVELVGYCQKCQ